MVPEPNIPLFLPFLRNLYPFGHSIKHSIIGVILKQTAPLWSQ